jgi:hypothetical protein
MPCKWKTTLAKHWLYEVGTLVVYHVRASKGGCQEDRRNEHAHIAGIGVHNRRV